MKQEEKQKGASDLGRAVGQRSRAIEEPEKLKIKSHKFIQVL